MWLKQLQGKLFSACSHLFHHAVSNVSSSHGHPCDLAHCRISSRPAPAAAAQTSAVHGQGKSSGGDRRYCKMSKCPFRAAAVQARGGHGLDGCSLRSLIKATRSPRLAALMQSRGSIPKLLCLQVQKLSFDQLLIRELYAIQ